MDDLPTVSRLGWFFWLMLGFMLGNLFSLMFNIIPNRSERRINYLKRQIKQVELRNELLKLEGRLEELTTKI